MDLDFLHAVFQFPVAAIELTVAIAMAARAYWAKHAAVGAAMIGGLLLGVGSLVVRQGW